MEMGLDALGRARFLHEELDRDGIVHVVNCGHPPPLRIVSGLPVPLGMGRTPCRWARTDFTTESSALERGECLVCFTDGVNEARTAAARFVDMDALGNGLARRGAAATALTVRQRLAERASSMADSSTTPRSWCRNSILRRWSRPRRAAGCEEYPIAPGRAAATGHHHGVGGVTSR